MARLVARQGRHDLAAAGRLEDRGERQNALAKARVEFDDAAKRLGAAAQLMAKLRSAGPQDKAIFESLLLQARYETQVIGLNKALTYGDRQFKTRAEGIELARKGFASIVKDYPDEPAAWLARVMIGRCWMELENSFEARKVFDAVAKEPGKNVPPEALRANRLCQLQLIEKDQNNKNRLVELQRGCDDWLEQWMWRERQLSYRI
jgi:hypothetical protein